MEKIEAEPQKVESAGTDSNILYNANIWIFPALIVTVIICILIGKWISSDSNSDYETISSLSDESLNNILTTPNGEPFFIDLGEFTDIEGFSDYAQKHLRGKIHFRICLTKDANDLALIQIKPKFLSRFLSTISKYSAQFTEQDKADVNFVGPIIYDKGRQWFNVWEDGEKTYDWQPTAIYENIELTPKAQVEVLRVLRFVNLGKISEKDGELYARDRQLTKEEIEEAKKWGILTRKNIFSKLEVANDYNETITK